MWALSVAVTKLRSCLWREIQRAGYGSPRSHRLYRLAPQRDRWIEQPLPSSVRGRLADLQITGDSVLLLSRSLLYRRSLSDPSWTTYELKKPDGYTGKILLFQILWMLHSGEYFGLTGRIIVDIIGLFVILLSITGIFYTIFSHRLMAKKNKHGTKEATEKKRQLSRKLSIHFKWHKVIGPSPLLYPPLRLHHGMGTPSSADDSLHPHEGASEYLQYTL